jgi:UPF0716 protein FxsA
VAVFALLFIVLPLVEIYVAVQVAHVIGVWETLFLLAALSIAGIYLTKYAGFGVLSRVRRDLARGEMPTNSLIDGLLVLIGGILLFVPGFVTAAAGLLLFFPPTRVFARNQFKRRFVRRITYIDGSGRTTYIDGSPRSDHVDGSARSGYLDGPDDIIDV